MSEDGIKKACIELLKKIKNKEITEKKDLEKEKTKISAKYNIPKLIKNAEILAFANKNNKDYDFLKKFLSIKPVRTGSGVANIAVMWQGDCPGSCIYCPRGENAPKSYTGTEPATLRAQRNNFDPYKQVENRLKQLHIIGHPTDKCELIIMGGTFPAWDFEKQKKFVKNCFDAFNNKTSKDLEKAQKINETAKNRVIGLTIETRPDFCLEKHIEQMLELGCTRVEIGVQATDALILKKIKRNHTIEEVKKATKLLKDAGLKVCYHWMPGLTGLLGRIDMEKELNDFKILFENEDFRPDELKIYPTLVLPGTKLYDLYEKGYYQPLDIIEMTGLLIRLKQCVPKYARIKRIMRDISQHESAAGPSTTNLRQLVNEKMEKEGIFCQCIRCREIGNKKIKRPKIEIIDYKASSGKEKFISFVDNDKIIGFLRLRITKDKALVRELHIYGPSIPLGMLGHAQHTGFGQRLLEKAEEITKKEHKAQLQVTSGIGAKQYYKRLGYKNNGFYMIKSLR